GWQSGLKAAPLRPQALDRPILLRNLLVELRQSCLLGRVVLAQHVQNFADGEFLRLSHGRLAGTHFPQQSDESCGSWSAAIQSPHIRRLTDMSDRGESVPFRYLTEIKSRCDRRGYKGGGWADGSNQEMTQALRTSKLALAAAAAMLVLFANE